MKDTYPDRNAAQLQCIGSAIAVQYFNAYHRSVHVGALEMHCTSIWVTSFLIYVPISSDWITTKNPWNENGKPICNKK